MRRCASVFGAFVLTLSYRIINKNKTDSKRNLNNSAIAVTGVGAILSAILDHVLRFLRAKSINSKGKINQFQGHDVDEDEDLTTKKIKERPNRTIRALTRV